MLRCLDHATQQAVALKIIRNKRRFQKQAQIEADILRKLQDGVRDAAPLYAVFWVLPAILVCSRAVCSLCLFLSSAAASWPFGCMSRFAVHEYGHCCKQGKSTS